ncbi:MAG TPA: sodium:proline symporter [Deltaproteobacteria bacterium]|nr:sodium:proline symporter [Deltaproteobacteria bacterium]|tara:strand:- start:472 stop:1851 length:1380 start_codon:yes stop_codon:yes gene_type:complete
MILVGFTLAMLVFFGVGMASMRHAKKEVGDYLVAERSVSPLSAGLSAVASNNSGFMFIGAIGFTYAYGLAAFWLFFAWIAGDYVSWLLVHRNLRKMSEARGSNSVAGFLAHDGEQSNRSLQLVLGVLTIVFLTLYAAAQLKAGGKALQSMLDWPTVSGVYIGAGLVLAYSFAGGIRASIWTDVAQSIVMILAMALLTVVCHSAIAPITEITTRLEAIDPNLLSLTPVDASLGLLPYAIGWFIAGIGGVGQPHIIVRAMAVESADAIPAMRRTYFSWYIVFSTFTMLVGLYARIHLNGVDFDAETALPILAANHLAPILVGIILASMFAATISTADSQVLACSASATQDIAPAHRDNHSSAKLATVAVVLAAMGVALVGPDSVFILVTVAWGLMTTCFAPLMIARCLDWAVDARAAITACVLGTTSMLGWTHVLGLGDAVYDGAVGFIVSMAIVAIASRR